VSPRGPLEVPRPPLPPWVVLTIRPNTGHLPCVRVGLSSTDERVRGHVTEVTQALLKSSKWSPTQPTQSMSFWFSKVFVGRSRFFFSVMRDRTSQLTSSTTSSGSTSPPPCGCTVHGQVPPLCLKRHALLVHLRFERIRERGGVGSSRHQLLLPPSAATRAASSSGVSMWVLRHHHHSSLTPNSSSSMSACGVLATAEGGGGWWWH
jgi:hypothetical protein